LADRKIKPFGFAGLAGHIDEGETPEEALSREVFEESGLKVKSCSLLFEEEVDWNWCSVGVKSHYWYVYQCEVEGEVKHNPDELKSSGWYTVEEIKKLELEPVWKYWFEKLGIL
jgi:NADH pyrophosphatase NudC (nudix superfamily)